MFQITVKRLMLYICFIFIFVISGCSQERNVNTLSELSYIYTKVDNPHNEQLVTLIIYKPNNINTNSTYLLKINDSSHLSFENGRDSYNITFNSGEMSKKLNVRYTPSKTYEIGGELSVSLFIGTNEYQRYIIAFNVLPNNTNAPLTLSLDLYNSNNNSIFNNVLNYDEITYQIMDINKNSIINLEKKYRINDIVDNKVEIVGLYANHENIIKISFMSNEACVYSQYIIVKTDDVMNIHENANLNFIIKKAEYGKLEEGFLFLPGYQYPYSLFIDKQGYVRGFYSTANTYLGQVTKLIDERFITDAKTSFVVTTLQGNVLVNIPYSFQIDGVNVSYSGHHDVIYLTSGRYKGMYAILVDKKDEITIEDYIIIIRVDEKNNTAELIKEIDLKNYLPQLFDRLPYTTNGAKDWFHANSIEHVEYDDTFIISGRNQGVIKITLPENNGIIRADKNDIVLKWIITPHIGFKETDTINMLDKLLMPLDKSGNKIVDPNVLQGYKAHDEFEWNYGQHTALYRNGRIIMYDNGEGRYNSSTNDVIETDGTKRKFSRFVEFEIDEENKTIKQIYDFGKNHPEFYSRIMSKVDSLSNNVISMYSAYQITNSSKSRYSTYIEIDKNSNEVLFNMEIRQDNMTSPYRAPTYRLYHMNIFDYINTESTIH